MSAITEDWQRIQELEARVKALEHLTHGHHGSIFTQRPVKAEPELIQGYTAEQWQEIIDGGYLCEFSDSAGSWYPGKQLLRSFAESEAYPFRAGTNGMYKHCRPAQIKGVVRPIFVEPVDCEDSMCTFFHNGFPVYTGRWVNKAANGPATKYIEL